MYRRTNDQANNVGEQVLANKCWRTKVSKPKNTCNRNTCISAFLFFLQQPSSTVIFMYFFTEISIPSLKSNSPNYHAYSLRKPNYKLNVC